MARRINSELFLLFGLLFAAASPVFSQSASLTGTVTDDSGAVVPGAKVSLVDSTNAQKSVEANNRGVYTFADLAPGKYTLQASAPQLVLAQPAAVNLNAGTQRFDVKLSVAQLVQQVDVDVDAPPAVMTDPASNAGATVMHGSDLEDRKSTRLNSSHT